MSARKAIAKALLSFGLCFFSTQIAAQGISSALDQGTVVSSILVIDSERLYRESAFGQRLEQDLEARGQALAAEFRKIEEALKAEEQDLTQTRATMTADEFRPLAIAFDEKVQSVRQSQTAKGRAFEEQRIAARDSFLALTAPILEELMRAAGADVLLERRSVLYLTNRVDVTNDAVNRLNQVLGAGEEKQP